MQSNENEFVITAEHLKAMREEKGDTQDMLADALKISRNTIANWERPGNKIAKLADIAAICGYFEIPIPGLQYDIVQLSVPEGKGIGAINEDENKNLIPVYDIDIMAGNGEMFQDGGHTAPAYHMDVPDFSGCIAFRVYSDSMAPLIEAGTLVFCRMLNDWQTFIEYGQIYAVQVADNRRFIKYIRKAADAANNFLMKSHNTGYDDFEVPKSRIRAVWLVEGWMRKKTQ